MGQVSELKNRSLALKLRLRALAGIVRNESRETRELEASIARLRSVIDELKANFDPNQPRVPAGNSDGGQWTDVGGSSENLRTGRSAAKGPANRGRSKWRGYTLRPGKIPGSSGVGHHYFPQTLLAKIRFRPETRKVLEKETVGPTIPKHEYSQDHHIYNELLAERVIEYSTRNRVRPEDWTPEHAKEFLAEIIDRRMKLERSIEKSGESTNFGAGFSGECDDIRRNTPSAS